MEEKLDEERWALVNSTENAGKSPEDDGEEDEEETLSLSDLPLNHQSRKLEKEEESAPLRAAIETDQEDFDFCSLSKESEMCAADEVFYQGQILPLRRNFSRSISRSEFSSRSSSMSSHQSSTSGSGSGSGSSTATGPKYKPILPQRNQFHSHPSPSPRLCNNRRGMVRINNNNCAKKSSVWNVFRLGFATPQPEIAFQDLKTRCPTNTNSTNFGSRNSTSSNSSSFSSSSDKKKKLRELLGGCKCSANAVDTVPSRVVIINRSASNSESEARQLRLEEENLQPVKPPELTKQQAAKKRSSHRRTFEWLKQLSLEEAADEQ